MKAVIQYSSLESYNCLSFIVFVSAETLLGNIQGLLKVTSDNVRMVERQMLVDRGIVPQLFSIVRRTVVVQTAICYIIFTPTVKTFEVVWGV